ncbi:hypothetical protein WAI453_009461 [Rhynchosporium graminicola]
MCGCASSAPHLDLQLGPGADLLIESPIWKPYFFIQIHPNTLENITTTTTTTSLYTPPHDFSQIASSFIYGLSTTRRLSNLDTDYRMS